MGMDRGQAVVMRRLVAEGGALRDGNLFPRRRGLIVAPGGRTGTEAADGQSIFTAGSSTASYARWRVRLRSE